jgi:hypothetical protein
VEHVYLAENSDPAPPNLQEQLQDFIDEGFVTFLANGMRVYQVHHYTHCMRNYYHKHNWMAFIDLDEFIVLRSKCVPSPLQYA